MTELKQVFMIGDRQFDTKAEAEAFLRRPKILEALRPLLGEGEKADRLGDWLIENQDTVEEAFDIGTIKRVTKAEQKKLDKDMATLTATREGAEDATMPKEVLATFAKYMPFIAENLETAISQFRHAPQKRMTDEEKAAEMVAALTTASENEALAKYIVENRAPIEEAYKAGKPARTVSPNASAALALYREQKAAEKAAREAGEQAPAAE